MKTLIFSIFIFLFVGCATVGTKTVYKTEVQPTVKKIGYYTLNNIDTLTLIYPETAQVFDSAIYKLSSIYSLDIPMKIKPPINSLTAKEIISDICYENGLDALLITNLTFTKMTYTVLYVPLATNYDTDVEMKLYDKYGELLYITKHNTYKGNSYMKTPTAERTVYDGIKGALTRIAKEIGWKESDK